MASNRNWRIIAEATAITTTGFTIHVNTWSTTILYAATAAWIAYPENKPGVTSGSFSTNDVRKWYLPRLESSATVKFAPRKFQGNPTVMVALNGLDFSCNRNLRLNLSADSVSKDGMTWHIDSWDDSVMYFAGASYIAFA